MATIFAWILPSVLCGALAGFYLGRNRRAPMPAEIEEAKLERAKTLKALAVMLESTERMSSDMKGHHTKLAEVGHSVEELNFPGEIEEVQQLLLGHISNVMLANQQLEQDLTCAKHRLHKQAEELDRTRLEARTDALSGTYNRKAFDETLQYLLASQERDNVPFVLVLIDIDHFKWINDTHGHAAGDKVVAGVGEILRQCVRSTDYVGRYGGDEFALLLTADAVPVAEKIAERIRRIVERRNWDVDHTGQRIAVTFSMGLAHARHGDTPASILERADRGLYKSKQNGRNQLHCFVEESGELVKVGSE